MEEFKYLKSTLMKEVSEELKHQPAFKEILEQIEGKINWGYSTEAPRSEIEVSNNSVKINLFYSYFGKNKENKNHNRTSILYEISLDNNQNVCYQKVEGYCEPKKIVINGEPQISNHVVYAYNIFRNIYQKDTKNIIERQVIVPPMIPIQESINDLHMYLPLENFSYEYKNFDDDMKVQMQYNMPNLSNDLRNLDSTCYGNYTVWSAKRNMNEPENATIMEYINLPYDKGKIITKKIFNKPVVNMSNPTVMRIDPPCCVRSYTSKEIETLCQAQCEGYLNSEDPYEIDMIINNPEPEHRNVRR